MTEQEFIKIGKALKGVYCQKEFLSDQEDLKVWYELLKDYDYKILQQATIDYMKNNHYPPTPADLIKGYKEIHNSIVQKSIDSYKEKIRDIENIIIEKNRERLEKKRNINDMLFKKYSKTAVREIKDIEEIYLYLSLKQTGKTDDYIKLCDEYNKKLNKYKKDYNETVTIVEPLPFIESKQSNDYWSIRELKNEINEMRESVKDEYLNTKELKPIKTIDKQIELLEKEKLNTKEKIRSLRSEILKIDDNDDREYYMNKRSGYYLDSKEEYNDDEYNDDYYY